MQFSELMRGMQRAGDGWKLQVPEDWQQGRSLFGGLQAALLARAMRGLLPATLPLRSLQVAFIAPVAAGEVQLRARLLRAGKNVQQLEARIVAGDETLCLGLGVYGAARESKVARMPAQPTPPPAGEMIALPIVPGVTDGMPRSLPAPVSLPYVPGLLPEFTQHFDARWLRAGCHCPAAMPHIR